MSKTIEFNVVTRIKHDGKVFEVGDTISTDELKKAQVKSLLASGSIEKGGAKKAAKKQTKTKKTVEPGSFKYKNKTYSTEVVEGQTWYRKSGKRISKEKWLKAQKKAQA